MKRLKAVLDYYDAFLDSIRLKFYQNVADSFIAILGKTAVQNNDKAFEFWYSTGLMFNESCIDKNIYLN